MLFQELRLFADPTPSDGFFNMALDQFLLQTISAPLLRLYRWDAPWVSFGYFGSHSHAVALHPNRPLVRRWTGGGLVEHGNDLTYSLIIPAAHPFASIPTAQSYPLIHKCLAQAFGPESQLAPGDPCSRPEPSPVCFTSPVADDLLLQGKKIAGAAQRRTRQGLLHQGSIRCAPDDLWNRLPALFAGTVRPLRINPDQLAAAHLLASERYASFSWLTRR